MRWGARMSSDSAQLRMGEQTHLGNCVPPWPAPAGLWSRETDVCRPTDGRDPGGSRPHGAAALGVDMAGRPSFPGLAEGLARRPRDTVGGCAGSRATATRYLSVGVDNQRINDLLFFTWELVQRVEISPLLPPSAGRGCSGQEAWRGRRLSRCPCSLRPDPEPRGPQTCHL